MTTIRPEQPSDYAATEEVNRLAFEQDAEADLVTNLREADSHDSALSLVAVRDGQVVGHILFSPILIETNGGNVAAMALAPMAVLPDFQGQGIGSSLVREGLEACRRAGHGILMVLGHADYYPRFGFKPANRHGLRAPFPVPDEVFMAMPLAPGGLDDISGVVRYPAAFDDV